MICIVPQQQKAGVEAKALPSTRLVKRVNGRAEEVFENDMSVTLSAMAVLSHAPDDIFR